MTQERILTGIPGLDEALHGGFMPASSVLLEGPPGSGKTNLGLQILYNGIVKYDQPGILLSFEQYPEQIYRDAASFGMDLRPLRDEGRFEVILTNPNKLQEAVAGVGSVTQEEVADAFARVLPRRILIDSISHFRRVTNDEVQLRELLMRMLHRITGAGVTAFLTKEISNQEDGEIAFEEYLVDASVRLYNLPTKGISSNRRQLEIRKTRGHGHMSGLHPMIFTNQGIRVYPHRRPTVPDPAKEKPQKDEFLSTGVRGLDYMLQGGLIRGTSTLIAGTAGAGKSTMALHFVKASIEEKEPCLLVILNESPNRIINFLGNIGVDVEKAQADNLLFIHYVSPISLCLDKLLCEIEECADKNSIRRIVVDSVSDFYPSLQDDNLIRDYLYTYVKFFENRGITALMTSEMETVTGGALAMSDINFAFVLDAVIYLGYVEVESRMRRVIMVLKQRGSRHETELRELVLADDGPKIGAKFTGLSGVSGGVASGHYQQTVDEMIQPLTFIRGFAEQMKTADLPEDKQKKLLDKMIEQSDQMIDYLCAHYGLEREKLLGE